jgi:hypothetical protein
MKLRVCSADSSAACFFRAALLSGLLLALFSVAVVLGGRFFLLGIASGLLTFFLRIADASLFLFLAFPAFG